LVLIDLSSEGFIVKPAQTTQNSRETMIPTQHSRLLPKYCEPADAREQLQIFCRFHCQRGLNTDTELPPNTAANETPVSATLPAFAQCISEIDTLWRYPFDEPRTCLE
jgi:hypothetical protein